MPHTERYLHLIFQDYIYHKARQISVRLLEIFTESPEVGTLQKSKTAQMSSKNSFRKQSKISNFHIMCTIFMVIRSSFQAFKCFGKIYFPIFFQNQKENQPKTQFWI